MRRRCSEINDIKQHHTNASQETQKEYYTQLTNTLRDYIVSRFGFNAMEMTSGEIIEHLRASGDQKMIDELRMLFSTADLVKFAKYEIPMNENDANLVNAINFIDQTKTDEQPKEEKIVPTLSTEDQKSQAAAPTHQDPALGGRHQRSCHLRLHRLSGSDARDVNVIRLMMM